MSEGPIREQRDASMPDDARDLIEPDALAAATGGHFERRGSRPGRAGSVDSRAVSDGDIFFALPGERTDGHLHLDEAAAAGAAALVIQRALGPAELDALWGTEGRTSIVRVDDTGAALRSMAAAYRDRFDPVIVGITGSFAKTSTKEQIAVLLARRFEVLRNEGNQNNEIGLPLTLLRMTGRHEVAVLEMGLYTTGEIALLASIARPAIGVVTAVRGVHLSRAGSIEAIEAGKRELVEALPPDGWAVLNVDDARVARMAGATAAKVRGYGFSSFADVRADEVESLGVEGMRFRLHLGDAAYPVTTPVLGRHGVHNALAAAAVAQCLDMPHDQIVAGLGAPVSMAHRTQLLKVADWTILDDSYNASPDTVLAALDLLAELPGRRHAVLGEMLELGDTAAPEHRRVGEYAAGHADELIVVGEGAAGIAEGALRAGMAAARVHRVDDRAAAVEQSLALVRPGDTVLVKASNGARFDLLVDQLVLAASTGGASA